jgi:DNA processing protein
MRSLALMARPGAVHATGVSDERASLWLALSEAASGRTDGVLRASVALGGPEAVLESAPGALRAFEVAPAVAAGIARSRPLPEVCRRWRERGGGIVCIDDEDYPEPLRRIADPPLLLFWLGRPPASWTPAVAVVGTRRASDYGLVTARRLGRTLAAAATTVVSGLAYGIDRAAHEGALEAGATVAVLAGGLDAIYPAAHRPLARRILACGALVSEQPPAVAALPGRFPVRNRIITGLAVATVVVEAGLQGGSLVSARLAAEQGRAILCVPGRIDSPASRGTNRLLARMRDVTLLEQVEDICPVLGISAAAQVSDGAGAAGQGPPQDPEARRVWEALGTDPRSADFVIDATALDGARVLALLTALELEGLVVQHEGALFTRA